MGKPLRQRRTAAEWAAARQVIEFANKLSEFEQLSSIVEADLGTLDAAKIPADWQEARVEGLLEFGFADAQGTLPSVVCRATTAVDAVCQRCLEGFRLPLEVEARLLLLDMEQTVDGYEEYEVWELEERFLQPADIVEEMLIMAMPFAAMHTNSASCRALTSPEASDAEETITPFAALREQMAKDNEDPA